MKKFFKSLPVIVIALVALSGLAIAGLLSYYGKVVGTATVEQSVRIDDKPYTQEITETIRDAVAGNTYYGGLHTLKNFGGQSAPITVTTSLKTGPAGAELGSGKDVEVRYVYADNDAGTYNCQFESGDEITPINWSEVSPLEQNEEVHFCIEYKFNIAAIPGDYEITTTVSPA